MSHDNAETIKDIWKALSLPDDELTRLTFDELMPQEYIFTTQFEALAIARRQYLISVLKILLSESVDSP